LWGARFSYAAGVFNGVPDGTSSTIDTDVDGAKELAGRLTVQPFRRAAGATRRMNGFGLHLGASWGTQTGALPSFHTSYGQIYFSYAAGATASGTQVRITPAVFYYYKSFGGFAEYIRSAQDVTHALVTSDVANHAWEVTGSYVLTGEAASDRGVRPRNNFDPATGHWGAVQLLARYTILTVDEDAFTQALAAAGASREARSWTLGLNWYPNPWIKWYVTVERTVFEDGVPPARPAENIAFLRFQLGF
jgi:phosphate-selective porin OprO/OprP